MWKAFKVCESTMNLSYEAARYIDQMLAPVLHSCTFAQIERTVAQAVDLYDPDEAERRAAKAADDRSFDIHLGTRGPTTDGTIAISGSVSLEDALDLEQAVKDGAKTLGDLGCDESPRRPPLDGRRRDGPQPTRPQPRNRRRRRRRSEHDIGWQHGGGRGVNLYAHLDPDTLHATVDNPGAGDVLIDQIKAWCQTVGNTVIIRPVIDLNTQISTNAYTPTEKLVEQVRLRDQVCVFPHCPRRARWCDLDHRTPYDKNQPRRRRPDLDPEPGVAVPQAPPRQDLLPLDL